MNSPVALGLAAGLLADQVLADPRRAHPVAGFGALAARVEVLTWRDSRLAGAVHAGVLVGGPAVVGLVLPTRTHGLPRAALVAAATWAVVGGTTLRREAATMAQLVGEPDLAPARARISHLCGRDPEQLDRAGLARATVESVAENTADAVVGPLVWGAVAGVPGLLAYRAVNTLDAMVGHRSPRYERFGWASARADDVANLLPARLTAALVVACAPVIGGSPRTAWRTWRRDGGKHPSPNAGPVEAAFAGALGRTLGGRLAYAGRVEDRPLLGNGPAPQPADIARAACLSLAVSASAGVLAIGARALLDAARR